MQSRLPIAASYLQHKKGHWLVWCSPSHRSGGGNLGPGRLAAHRVDTAVAAVLELALAVRAGLCRDGTGEEEEAEADDGDHFGYWKAVVGVGVVRTGLDND